MELSKHVIDAKDRNLQQLLETISCMKSLVIVTIAGSPEVKPMAYSHENLRAIIEGTPERLLLGTLPVAQFVKWAGNQVAQWAASASELRKVLRTRRVSDLLVEIRAWIAGSGELLNLLVSYIQQAAPPVVAVQVEELQRAVNQLTDSCFQHEDNVRCMDSLQYEILPPLKKLQKFFEK